VLTLLLDESLASACLLRLGISRKWLISGELGDEIAQSAANEELIASTLAVDEAEFPGDDCHQPPRSLKDIDDPIDFTRVLDRATEIARRGISDTGVSSANLLLAIVETDATIRERFESAGATLPRILAELYPEPAETSTPLAIDVDLQVSFSEVTTQAEDAVQRSISGNVWRVVDANLNRAREGLRVLEDFCRFLVNAESLSGHLKTMRHELVAAEKLLLSNGRAKDHLRETLSHRDTTGDVGTGHTASNERVRGTVSDVVIANCRRVQESLRSLEEFGKLLSAEFASTIKQLRYQSYTIEKQLMSSPALSVDERLTSSTDVEDARTAQAGALRQRLQTASVYVLITESMCRHPWRTVVEQALEGGADVLQLREKSLGDRELLQRATWVRDACRSAGALFVMNDRPDLAVAVQADAVHVGQEELSVAQSRKILGRDQLVGVSTHDAEQAQRAFEDGADYIGVGPVFPSKTKSFDAFPGLEFVRQVAAASSKPWFAIGGISLENIDPLIQAGARRVAVTSVVAASDEPAQVVREFRRRLQSV
jgi:thiamine-phosphate pyrophosphorylase